MANLELTIESAILARAQQRALEQGTSLDVVVRDYLTDSSSGEIRWKP